MSITLVHHGALSGCTMGEPGNIGQQYITLLDMYSPCYPFIMATCCTIALSTGGVPLGLLVGFTPQEDNSAIWRNLLTSRIQVYLDNFYLAIVGMQR